jgi:hypothetical protein
VGHSPLALTLSLRPSIASLRTPSIGPIQPREEVTVRPLSRSVSLRQNMVSPAHMPRVRPIALRSFDSRAMRRRARRQPFTGSPESSSRQHPPVSLGGLRNGLERGERRGLNLWPKSVDEGVSHQRSTAVGDGGVAAGHRRPRSRRATSHPSGQLHGRGVFREWTLARGAGDLPV